MASGQSNMHYNVENAGGFLTEWRRSELTRNFIVLVSKYAQIACSWHVFKVNWPTNSFFPRIKYKTKIQDNFFFTVHRRSFTIWIKP